MLTTEITILWERLIGYKKRENSAFFPVTNPTDIYGTCPRKTQEEQMVTLQGDACLGHESPKDEKNAPMEVT